MKKTINIVMTTIVALVGITALTFAMCTFSPAFRDTYTNAANSFEVTIHDTIEEYIGVDLPYTQYTEDGHIVLIK